jgi:hypothetical protein
MLIIVISIVWLAISTLVVCACRIAAASDVAGAPRHSSRASIGVRLVLEPAQAERASAARRPIHCQAPPQTRRLTARRLRSATHVQ